MGLLPSEMPAAGGWDMGPSILGRIKAPVFPDRAFDVTRYGAAADGKTDCTVAIAQNDFGM